MILLETWRTRFASKPQSYWNTFNGKTDDQVTEMLRNPEQLGEISNELADVIIYCLGFSDVLSIDVSNAIRRKLQKNAEKYPAQRRG